MRSQVVVLLLSFVLSALAQDFTCSLEYRTPLMRNGAVSGTIDYSFTRGRMKLTFAATATRPQSYVELHQYNQAKGLAGGAAPYLDQWVFRTGSSCACETGHLDAGMPILSPQLTTQLTTYYDRGTAANGCTTYTRKSTAVDPKITTMALGTQFPCSARFADGKTYTFSNCRAATFTDSTFTQPSDCKCGKPLDIAVVMDRSSSISKVEFNDQKGFVTDFANQFEYSQFKANLALVHFKSTAWTTLRLTEGISKANVDAAVKALGCPASCDELNGKCVPNDPTTCCCCCGTSVSSGIRMGADQLKTGRSFASKLLIVITDGYHNTLFKLPGPGPECGNDRTACTQDLRDANTYVFNTLGGRDKVAIYAVGVGSDRDISTAELTLIADGQTQRVLRRNNFAELAANNLELIARACDENVAPCGGCCGFCVCGSCLQPDSCDSANPCNPSRVPTGQTCCVSTPVTCTAEETSDPCHTYKCDATSGRCVVNTTIDCGVPTNTACFRRECNRTLGRCETISLCTEVPQTECTQADLASCDDNNKCTREICTPEGKCAWEKLDCAAQGFVANACVDVQCLPDSGCKNTSKLEKNPDMCNDNNNCTIDVCDPVLGCTHTPVNCSDGNLCTTDLCDPNRGCIFPPKDCSNPGTAQRPTNVTCGVSFCEEGVCKIRAVPCVGPNIVAIGAGVGLGTAALVGIIVAAVLCFGGLAGGGVYAAAQGAGGGPMGGLQNNPIYKADSTAGMNPLYKSS